LMFALHQRIGSIPAFTVTWAKAHIMLNEGQERKSRLIRAHGVSCKFTLNKDRGVAMDLKEGSPYKTMQVWEYYPVLLCKYLIFRYALL
jgi:hypothetical protein